MSQQEQVTGGSLGQVVGRAKQMVGAALGRDGLVEKAAAERGRLSGEQRSEEKRQQAAAGQGAAKREAADLKREAARAEEAAAAIESKEKN